MSQRLEINNEEIILSNQLVTITKSAYDFTDLNERNIDITNRINLPNNEQVRTILEHPEKINANNNSFEKYFEAKIYDLSILFRGVAEIQEITRENISIQLIDSAKELIDSIKVDANSLDIDSYDFTFNLTNYNALRQLSTNIWVFPVTSMRVDRKQIPTLGSVNEAALKYIRPMFSVKRLLDLAFEENGWTYDRSFVPLIDKLLLSANHEAFYVSSYLKEVTETVTAGNYITGLSTYTHKNSEVTANNDNIEIHGRKTKIALRGDVVPAGNATITIEYETESQSFFVSADDTEINFLSDSFESDTTGTVKVKVTGSNITFDGLRLYTVIDEAEFADLDNGLINFRVLTYENLDYSLYQIFKTSLVLNNAFFTTNKDTQTIIARKIGSLNKINSLDWSDKFIEDSEEINNDSLTLYKKSFLSYSNDDTLPQNYGRYSFTVNSDRLEDEGEVLKIPYSASYDLSSQSQTIAYLPIYGTEENNDLTTSEKRLNDLDARLLYYEEVGSDSIAKFAPINFNELAPEFSDLLASLSRPRVIEAAFNLTKLDVLSFDFTKLVYIDRFKSHFYVLEIKDFEPSQLTEVKLLKFR